jgi:hypothetical protein
LQNKTSSDQKWKISKGLLWYPSVLKSQSVHGLFIIWHRQYCQQHCPQYINCDRPNSPHTSPSTQTSGWRVGSSCFQTCQMPQPTHRPMNPPYHSDTKFATIWTCLSCNLSDKNRHHTIKYIVQWLCKPRPRRKVLLENMTVPQLDDKLVTVYGTRGFITVFTTACNLTLTEPNESIPCTQIVFL